MLRTLTGKVTIGVLTYIMILMVASIGSLQNAIVSQESTRQLAESTLIEATLNQALIFRLSRAVTELVSSGARLEAEEIAEARENLLLAREVLEDLIELQATEADADYTRIDRQRLTQIEYLEQEAERLEQAIDSADQPSVKEILEDLEDFDAEIEALIQAQDAVLLGEAETNIAAVKSRISTAQVIIPTQFFILGSIAALAAWLLHRFIVRPVRDLAKVAVAVGDGQFERRIPDNGIDEMGMLQGVFIQMMAKLRERDAAVTTQMAATRTALDELEVRAVEQTQLVAVLEGQREVIRHLSVPVLPISNGLLVMPLVGTIDSERQQLLQAQALEAIGRTGAHTLLLDVTGVPIVDATVAQGLFDVIQSARLLTRVLAWSASAPR
ncbi:MAG: HAMP domain-containing protein [Oscillochloris sp.]|nr:HAMP domain-containing protein [Oscillochloris sp.]